MTTGPGALGSTARVETEGTSPGSVVTIKTDAQGQTALEYSRKLSPNDRIEEIEGRAGRLAREVLHVAKAHEIRVDPFTGALRVTYGPPQGENLSSLAAREALMPHAIASVFDTLLACLEAAHDKGLLLGSIRAQDIFVPSQTWSAVTLVGAGIAVPVGWRAEDDVRAIVTAMSPFVAADDDDSMAPEEMVAVIGRYWAATRGGEVSDLARASGLRAALTAAMLKPRRTGTGRRPVNTNPLGSRIGPPSTLTELPAAPVVRPGLATAAPPAKKKSRAWLFVALLLLIGGGLAAFFATRGSSPDGSLVATEKPLSVEKAPTREAAAVTAPPAVQPATASAPPAAPAVRSKVLVKLATTPSGANVKRGDALLGETPLVLELDRATHALTIEKQGFAPETLALELAGTSVELLDRTVTLTALPVVEAPKPVEAAMPIETAEAAPAEPPTEPAQPMAQPRSPRRPRHPATETATPADAKAGEAASSAVAAEPSPLPAEPPPAAKPEIRVLGSDTPAVRVLH